MPKPYPARFDNKKRDITLIHVARQQVGMAEDTYRELLRDRFKVKSSTALNAAQRQQLLDHFKSLGFEVVSKKANEWAFIDKAAADRRPLLKKICMVCKSMQVGKAYAEGAAKRQHGIDRKLEMMDERELWLLAGVLERTKNSKEARPHLNPLPEGEEANEKSENP